MSLAVSAVIRPSRLLRSALVVYAAANFGAGLALASNPHASFLLSDWLAGCCLLAAAGALCSRAGAGNTRRVDISGLLEIRVTVQQNVEMRTNSAHGALMHLMQGSTVWPSVMLLLLRADDGSVTVLTVMPDSVAPDQFRALAVAIRAIAGRNNSLFGADKIL
jgi:toxin CptA